MKQWIQRVHAKACPFASRLLYISLRVELLISIFFYPYNNKKTNTETLQQHMHFVQPASYIPSVTNKCPNKDTYY